MKLHALTVLTIAGMFATDASVKAQFQGDQYPFNFATAYDSNTMLTLTGKITRVDWSNPLVHIYMDVADGGGKVTAWAFETYPPNKLKRDGFPRETLNVGDVVTVTAYKAKDGSNAAMLRAVTLPDGSKRVVGAVAQ